MIEDVAAAQPPTEAEITNWAMQARDLRARARSLTQLADRYVSLLRQALGDKHEGTHGDASVSIKFDRTFSVELARQVLTPDEIAACTVPVLDPDLVKQLVAPQRFEECRINKGNPTVRIK